jgi:hypothetical protein
MVGLMLEGHWVGMLKALGGNIGALLNAFYPFVTLRAGSEAQRRRVPQRILSAESSNINTPSENI